MTLLESVVAFVLLAVVGVACLDLTQGATRLTTSSVAWTRAIAVGESALEAAAAGSLPDDPAFRDVRVARRAWGPDDDAIDVIEVQVPLPGGASFRLSRLTPALRRTAGAMP